MFEEAIFIVREDYMKTAGVTRSQLLSEARRAAGSYTGSMQRSEKKCRQRLSRHCQRSSAGCGGSNNVFHNVTNSHSIYLLWNYSLSKKVQQRLGFLRLYDKMVLGDERC